MVMDRAQAIIAARYNPQQQAIQNRISQANQNTQIRADSIQNQGNLARGYVGDAYGILDSSLGQNRDQAMASLNTQANQIGQGYRDAQQIGTSVRDASRNALAQLAQQLNAGNYAMPVIGGLEAEANQMIQRNADRDATLTGNLRNWSAQSGDVYNRQIGMGHQMRADAMSRLESDLLRYLSESNLQGAEEVTDLGDLLTELLGKRSADLAETVNELSAQDFDQSYKQAQLDMAAAELNARMADSAADRDLRAAAMQQEQGRWEAEFGKSGELSEKEKLALQMEAWGMQQDQSRFDQTHSLDRAKLQASLREQPASLSERIQLAEAMLLAGNDPSRLEAFYAAGVLPRPSGGNGAGIAQVAGTSMGRTGGGLASLRSAHSALARPRGGPGPSYGGYSALPVVPRSGFGFSLR